MNRADFYRMEVRAGTEAVCHESTVGSSAESSTASAFSTASALWDYHTISPSLKYENF